MPTYQYACTACGHQLEAVQSFSDPALTECPACEGRLRKLFSAVGIVFKGSGFYRTDSRSGSASGSECGLSKTKEGAAASSSSGSGDSAASSSSSSGRPSALDPRLGPSASGSGSGSGTQSLGIFRSSGRTGRHRGSSGSKAASAA